MYQAEKNTPPCFVQEGIQVFELVPNYTLGRAGSISSS